MRILIDTNVFISRERDGVVPQELQRLENLLKTRGHDILVHPYSIAELEKHENEAVREKSQSKIRTYAKLEFPPYPSREDREFYSAVNGPADNRREEVDNALLYAVYSDRVDQLITEDQGIHSKAEELEIGDQVLTIAEGAETFQEKAENVRHPVSVEKTTVKELDSDDPIFESIKTDYEEFTDWFNRVSDRDAWVNWNSNGTLGAVLILKYNEVETLGENPQLSPKPRLKICTLKVAECKRGSKAGELLISLAIREAIQRGLEEIYFTHYVQGRDDYLVELVSRYGFTHKTTTRDGESIFLKRLIPGPGDVPTPVETMRQFYPSFHDGPQVSKYLIPVRPRWHNKLFPGYEKRQPTLDETTGQFIAEANAIKKAYLTHANIQTIEPADILLFYRSHDQKELTSLCVCEHAEYNVRDTAKIKDIVGSRSVYSESELDEMLEKPTTVLLFNWHFDLPDPIRYKVLIESGVLNGPPQTIRQLDHKAYNTVKQLGDIDERFIID